MKLRKTEVTQQIQREVAEANKRARRFQQLPPEALHHRPDSKAWSALDCIEHMNLFYDDYLPRVEAAVKQAAPSKKPTYSPGFFGQKMIDSLRPQRGKRRMKVKTFKKMTPATDNQAPEAVFGAFFRHHAHLEDLLSRAAGLNWNRTKVTSAIGPILRFRLGDCFRLLLAHTERHLLQAQQAMKNEKS